MNPPSQTSAGAASHDPWTILLSAVAFHLNGDGRMPLASLLRQVEDWDAVLQFAERHGVSPLLQSSLLQSSLLQSSLPPPALLQPAAEGVGESVPPAVSAQLRQSYQLNIRKTLLLSRELIRLLDALDSQGLEALPYKGAVLAETYYGDMALRQSGDMDLFVRAKDLPRIKSVALGLGYSARLPVPPEAESDYIAAGYEYTFDSGLGKNLLELQWALQPRYYAVDFDMPGLFERAVKATVAGRVVRTPSPEDLLLILSLHAAKHAWGRLIWLCDIAQILKRENLDWLWIEAQSRKLGIERILHLTLLLCQRLLATEIPPSMQAPVAANRAAQALVGPMLSSIARGVEYEEEKLSYFRLMASLRERPRDRFRFWSRLAFTPGPGEWEAIRLARPLFPLYRIVRLVRLAARLAR